MLRPPDAIELLIAAGVARVELNNEQPHRPKINLAMTIEAQAAELISHYARREQELLEANNRYLERARRLQAQLIGVQVFTEPSSPLPSSIGATVVSGEPLTASALADALDCFWNASLSEGHNRGGTAMDCATVTASGFAAVSAHLRAGGFLQQNATGTPLVDKSNNGEILAP